MKIFGQPFSPAGSSVAPLVWVGVFVLILMPKTVGVTAREPGVTARQSKTSVVPGEDPRDESRPCRPTDLPAGARVCPEMQICLAELMDHLRGHEVVFIDVRDPAAYWRGHLPGALSMPFEGIEMLASALRASDVLVVTYGEEAVDRLSLQATEELRRLGVTEVRALEDGFLGWVAAGHVVVTQPS